MKKNPNQENPAKNKIRVYYEAPKTNHTTHWDLDYMTKAQIDSVLDKGRRKRGYRRKIRIAGIILGLVVLILIALYFVHSNYPS
jgi:hypothetical protein